jgi:hypothetical protein
MSFSWVGMPRGFLSRGLNTVNCFLEIACLVFEYAGMLRDQDTLYVIINIDSVMELSLLLRIVG